LRTVADGTWDATTETISNELTESETKMTNLHVCSECGNEVETEGLPGDGLMSCSDHPSAMIESIGAKKSETKTTTKTATRQTRNVTCKIFVCTLGTWTSKFASLENAQRYAARQARKLCPSNPPEWSVSLIA
jgi:hypothetical protein